MRKKSVKPFKPKKNVNPKGGTDTYAASSAPKQRTKKAEDVLDQEKAAYELTHRATKDFTRSELGALMQVPPGGAEPHQIKKQSRQFNRVAEDIPKVGAEDSASNRGSIRAASKPMSAKTPKIDPED
jgi:hypothetical protein